MSFRNFCALTRPGVSLAVALGTLCGTAFYALKYNTSYDLSAPRI